MSAKTVIAWRNWCTEHGAITGSVNFSAGAPASNLLTPQLGQVAIAADATLNNFVVNWATGDSPEEGGRPVQIIGLLNHNIIDLPPGGEFKIKMIDASGGLYAPSTFPVPDLFTPGDGTQQNHLFWVLPDSIPGIDLDNIVEISIGLADLAVCGTIDPFTRVTTEAPFSAGGIWAGPLWTPENGIRVSLNATISEARRSARSIGGQVYASPEPRVRSMSFTFGLLTESEVYNTDLAGNPGLQQMATWACVSRPIIVIPDANDPDLVYLQGIYGYLDNFPTWSSVEGAGYQATLSITEAL